MHTINYKYLPKILDEDLLFPEHEINEPINGKNTIAYSMLALQRTNLFNMN